jgi:hypothetical protein
MITGSSMETHFSIFPITPAVVSLNARKLTLQIFRNRRKLLQRRFQFLGCLQSEHVRIRKIRAVFERFVP